MSMKTWRKEFYPIHADKVPIEEAAQHSLQKWIGLRPENLAKHDVTMSGSEVYNNNFNATNTLELSGQSCALCYHYLLSDLGPYEPEEPSKAHECFNCPLAIVRGGVPCDSARGDERYSPFAAKVDTVEPMIFWLEKAVKLVRES